MSLSWQELASISKPTSEIRNKVIVRPASNSYTYKFKGHDLREIEFF